ncbi:hypothetical protein [Nostoc sp. DedSLP04]|uniref:hypothetical protein n=1 Tax=Nostoc sp. DedSLP04 TaxID=3075401 RepID=UPI002AD37A2E|nr:hypothetical protein [Nostoc sp. DedSLP04]MDZ8034793.1 hypothetical protein [Nostoc sp. DedSLP04]
MKKQIKDALDRGVIMPALTTILVCGALGLAIADAGSRPAYYSLVQTVIITYFRIPGKSDNGGK